MTSYQPANNQIFDVEMDDFVFMSVLKDYAPGRGGRMFQIPKKNNIQKRSRDLRINPRNAAMDYALQQVRHVQYCCDKNCGYQWCGAIKSLLQHWPCCKDRRDMKKCNRCDSLRVLFLRAQGKFVSPARNRNTNTNNNDNRNNRNNINNNNNRGNTRRNVIINTDANANTNTNLNSNVITNLTINLNSNTTDIYQQEPPPPITAPTSTIGMTYSSVRTDSLIQEQTNTETDVHT